ncbi:MAG: hypothetical protein Crog4KO_15900 [Crocinitomicaceae bacterium]
MKTILFSFALLCGFALNAQTSVVGLKSHHGDIAELPESEDKFGMVMPSPVYDTLIRISGDCVIQLGSRAFSYRDKGVRFRDTVCEHWYYQKVDFDEKLIQEYHGGNVTMIGFESTENYRKKQSPYFRKRSVKQSSKELFILLVLIGLGVFLIQPKVSWKK